MIKVMFLPVSKERPILSPRCFYVDTHNYAQAEIKARAEFSSDPKYQEYGTAVCINVDVIYP